MTCPRMPAAALLSTLAALAAPAAAAADAAAPAAVAVATTAETVATVHAWQGLGRTAVDGDAAGRTQFRAFGADVGSIIGALDVAVSVERLVRETRDGRTGLTLDKTTMATAPAIGWEPAAGVRVGAAYEVYRTTTENGFLPDEEYALHAGRPALALDWALEAGDLAVRLAGEALAEKSYAIGAYPMTDRDHIPAQLDVGYTTQVADQLTVGGGLRYSQYNKKVYEDDYEGDVPTSPTARQVLDYLLTLTADASYQATQWLTVDAAAVRKGALDTDSYAGDEYVVGYGGSLGVRVTPRDGVEFGTSARFGRGAKEHKVQGVAYDYANRVEAYEATATVSL